MKDYNKKVSDVIDKKIQAKEVFKRELVSSLRKDYLSKIALHVYTDEENKCPKCKCPDHYSSNANNPTIYECVKCGKNWNPNNAEGKSN